MQNAVFRDIKTQFVPHRKHYVSVTEPRRLMLCKTSVFMAVPTKNAVFWDIKTQFLPHRNTLRLCYSAQPVNAM
jgi:hypothetical protein